MTDNPEELRLEQRCMEPGHWLIEGLTVKRVKIPGWGIWWLIRDRSVQRRTLAEIREWIRDES